MAFCRRRYTLQVFSECSVLFCSVGDCDVDGDGDGVDDLVVVVRSKYCDTGVGPSEDLENWPGLAELKTTTKNFGSLKEEVKGEEI